MNSQFPATGSGSMPPAAAPAPLPVLAGAAPTAAPPLVKDLVPPFLLSKSLSCQKTHVFVLRFFLDGLTATCGGRPIDQASSLLIQQAVLNPRWSPTTQKDALAAIRNFLHWVRGQGHLPANQPTAADLVHLNVRVLAPRFIRPEGFSRLLRSTREVDLLLEAVLHALAGLEGIELRRLDWEHIRRKLGILISSSLSGRVRLAPILRALDAWLCPFYGCSGPVLRGWKSELKFKRWAREQNVRDLVKLLCNSYRVYRLAQTGNPGRTATEVGLDPVRFNQRFGPIAAGLGAQADEYFSFTPAKVGLRNWRRMVEKYLAQNPPRRRNKTP